MLCAQDMKINLGTREEPAAPVRWLFLGDSITHGAFHTLGGRDYTELFKERVRWELNRRKDMVLNMGMSGFTSGDLVAELPFILQNYRPDIVFIMIGTNDAGRGVTTADFQHNLEKTCGLLDPVGCRIIWQTPPCPNGTVYGERMPALLDGMRALAAERNEILVDHYAFWSGQKRLAYWLSDHIHPNREGHCALAAELFRQLGIFDPEADTCRLYIP